MMPDLKVKGVKAVPDWATKEIPITVSVIITDKNGDRHQSDVEMDKGFDLDGFREAMMVSFDLCDTTPSEVEVVSVVRRPNDSSNN